ncbi:MAG: NAD-dependent epimerase/dehydratase family protein [Burkholderiales bacterium]|nr:NAD-dependent epimerase/dehydratase family protein [Burkholderiales bacterium]
MKLLILGGTRFLGRHLAQQALAAGHALTLLHRGRSGPGLFPEAEHLIADRDADLGCLAGRHWDVAIDTSAYLPRQVRAVAAALSGRVGQYQLVSSISVYASYACPGLAEDAPLQTLADPGTEVVDGATYGGLKALCEQAALAGFGAPHCLIARPGLLVGPHDPTGRFTWWVQRIAAAADGGEVLAPGDPAAPVQFIDVRDAAAWLLTQAERGSRGRFNLTGPTTPTCFGDLLAAACDVLAPAARLTWIDEACLLAQGVAPWTELPLWLPRDSAGLHQVSIARALALGLHCRPMAQTLADTAAWAASAATPVPAPPCGGPLRQSVGLAPEREAALLAVWHAATGR